MKAFVKASKDTYEINNIINVMYTHGNIVLTSCNLSTGKIETHQYNIESLQFGQVVIIDN